MSIMEVVVGVISLLLLGIIVWDTFLNKKSDQIRVQEKLDRLESEKNQLLEDKVRLRADLENKSEELGKTSQALQQEKSQRDKMEGKGKQIFIENTNLQNEVKNARSENSELKKICAEYDAQKEQKESEFSEKIKKLEHAQKSLEDEKLRIRREDEERQEQILEEKNRIWNDHETAVLARLRDVCEKPEMGFQYYDNQNLPSDFDARIKPDFLMDFLGQYVIFDAKKSKDPQTYILDQVKKTAKKCKGNDKIYSTIFFVMPDDDVTHLKKLSFFEEGYSFYIISSVAIEPILASFKKISEYEKISEFDPKDRETIINLVANYDRHISFQNASNILLAKESVSLMNTKEGLKAELQKDIAIRKQSMRPIRLKDADIRNLSRNLNEQESEIENLVSPKVSIEQEDIRSAQKLFDAA